MSKSSSSSSSRSPHDPWAAVVEAIRAQLTPEDLDRALRVYPDIESIARRMLQALPDSMIIDPPIGACYTSAALAAWRRVSRQAIAKQRARGRIFGVKVRGLVYYPSVQFDDRGQQSREFAAEFSRALADGIEPVDFAVWLATPDIETGISPGESLVVERIETRTRFDSFTPRMIQVTGKHSPTIAEMAASE